MHLDHDCLVQLLAAAARVFAEGQPPSLHELCRLACVSRSFRRAANEVLSRVQVLQPTSLGPHPNRLAARNHALCLPCGSLDLGNLLQRCTALTTLSLAGLHRIASDQLLCQVTTSCCQLSEVCLDACTGITAEGLQALAAAAPNLRRLSLQRCTGVGAALPLQRLVQLTELDLAWCREVDATALSGSQGTLRMLCLHGCERVGDDICSQLPQVEELSLAFTAVTDAGLMALAVSSPQLRKLTLAARGFNLWETGRWTDAGLAAFQAAAPRVHVSLVTC